MHTSARTTQDVGGIYVPPGATGAESRGERRAASLGGPVLTEAEAVAGEDSPGLNRNRVDRLADVVPVRRVKHVPEHLLLQSGAGRRW
jgi:hypothetical protein